METPAPQSPEPAPERKGVLAFVQSLKAPAAAQEKSSAPSSGITPLNTQGPLYHHFAEFSWSLHQNAWLKVSFIVHVVLMLLIWFGAYLAMSRPTYLQVGNLTLDEAAKEYYGVDYAKVDPNIAFDQMSYFIISSLSMLHQVDAYSTPPLPLLKGMVNDKVIEKSKKYFDNHKGLIQSQKFVQTLVINRILSPIENAQNKTLAIFVEGYFSIALQDKQGNAINRITPYRGKALLHRTPLSTLNPFPFTLDELDEVVGAENCKKWDADNKKFFQ